DSEQTAARCRSTVDEQGWGFWAVELRSTGEFVGFVGLHAQDTGFPFSPCVEVAWRLARVHWGRGYATEAAQASLVVGFDLLRLQVLAVT
ncbi:MAG: GNAT family N-acetyltransferase, partial [Acidimicrobiales bacterium]